MKKTLLVLGLALAVLSASAQEGEAQGGDFTRQKGDISLGIDATPFLEYIGNAFNTNKQDAPFFDGATITGKYFLSEDRAIRAKLGIHFNTTVTKDLEADIFYEGDADPWPLVENTTTQTTSNIIVGVGYEFHRGTGRLQALYGAEVFFTSDNGVLGGSTSFEYGNKLDKDKNNPGAVGRPTETIHGARIGFGLNGFLGIEYFLTPSISLGGQVSLGVKYLTTPKGELSSEGFDKDDNVKTTTIDWYAPDSEGGLKINTQGSQISLSFYF